MHRFVFFCFFLILLCPFISNGSKLDLSKYGPIQLSDSTALKAGTVKLMDSVFAHHPMTSTLKIIGDIEKPHPYVSRSADFYLLLFLCLMLGVIRFSDERYFFNLWSAFWNPTLSNRQLKDQLQGAGFSNFLMNLFFTIAEGAYIYYVVRLYTPGKSGVIPPSLLIIMLMAGTGLIYLSKFAAVKFSGWAFRMEGVTEHYLFNVFLINKILAMVLIPFIIVLAFADRDIAQQIVIISFVISGILLLTRYIRSWEVFGSFFQYSKFHFFMYLCASEILPLAVLMKLLVKGLMFY